LKEEFVFLNIFLFSTLSAQAQYIDPGSGSYFFQLILGGFLVFAFYFKTIKYKIKSLIVSAFKTSKKNKNAQ